MKLVSAKCPSCGAKLDVNPKNEAIKCEYCQSAILVDDAIAKYRLEVSGEIEIKNLPKVDNYLKLAERNYNNKDYDEAYKNYGLVIELDPNNTIALLRYGICKTLLNNYIDFNLDYLIKTVKDTVKILRDTNMYEKHIETYVEEVIVAIDESFFATEKYYNSYVVTESDLNEIHKKLISIVECYEVILDLTNDSKMYVMQKIIAVLNNIIKDKKYKSGHNEYGGDVIKSYKLDYKDKIHYINKLHYYKKLINSNDDEIDDVESDINSTETLSDVVHQISKKWSTKGLVLGIDIFLWLLMLGATTAGQIVSAIIIFMIFFIITFTKISNKWFKDDKKKKKNCIIILVTLLLITIMCGI